jgi:hypothetical protein
MNFLLLRCEWAELIFNPFGLLRWMVDEFPHDNPFRAAGLGIRFFKLRFGFLILKNFGFLDIRN